MHTPSFRGVRDVSLEGVRYVMNPETVVRSERNLLVSGLCELIPGLLRATARAHSGRFVPHAIGGGLPSTLAGSAGSQSQTMQAWRNAERANSTPAACGWGLLQTSAQSRMYSPSVAFPRADAAESVAAANPSGAGCA